MSSPARAHLVVPLQPPHVAVQGQQAQAGAVNLRYTVCTRVRVQFEFVRCVSIARGLLVPHALRTFWAFIQSATGGSVYRRVKRHQAAVALVTLTMPLCSPGASLWRFSSRRREHSRTRALWGTGPVRQRQALGGLLSCTKVAQLAPYHVGV